MRVEKRARQVVESWRPEIQFIRKVSPAHRRVAVGATPFDVNAHHRALLSEIFGCYQSVFDRSWQTIRSATGRDTSVGSVERHRSRHCDSGRLIRGASIRSGLLEMQSNVKRFSV